MVQNKNKRRRCNNDTNNQSKNKDVIKFNITIFTTILLLFSLLFGYVNNYFNIYQTRETPLVRKDLEKDIFDQYSLWGEELVRLVIGSEVGVESDGSVTEDDVVIEFKFIVIDDGAGVDDMVKLMDDFFYEEKIFYVK